ncbi:adenosylcobalamin-dependent ribonucleoside-diphosphate reductase [Candidatus Woesearchaeota archaeon]|nr:adenosylcobalamin-dependent ribonucleoside-diphosphate reductase [Candidatus Woesearchaeota archaeon]
MVEYNGKKVPGDLPRIVLTENQEKVIKDKYLKDAPTPESWLWNIAMNIAMADALYMKEVREEDVLKGIKYSYETHETLSGHKTKILLLHQGFHFYNEWDANFKKFIKNLDLASQENRAVAEKITATARRFYKRMASFEFLPNSPTLMNAGRPLQQLSACYVLPVGDSIEEIYDATKNMALVHKSGGGTGFSFSKLRPKNDPVKTTRGVSSGPVSFMSLFDKSTDVVKQGGTRRGANMGILRYDHPDIREFIHCKDGNNSFENFNISVAIDDKFMNAARAGEELNFINPRDGKTAGTFNARELFDEIIESAWKSGDPGIVIIDRINRTESNPTPNLGQIESTNPCGEQPLLPYEPCNLGSINLFKFVDDDGHDFDWARLKECVHDSVAFLDNVIDINNYPLPKIEYMAKLSRRIGLGVMGWAESLVLLGLPYNSNAALRKAEEVMGFIDSESRAASENLAKERGLFASWLGSIYDPESKHFRGKESRCRNSAITTIAPTGTIGITAGLQGAGIEPFFAIAYVRYNAAGIDALKKGETPAEKDTFFEVNPLFKKIAAAKGFFGLQEDELYKKIEENHKSLLGMPEIPDNLQRLFLTSHDIAPVDHLKMQVAFQKYTNNAVSKTVNLKNEATVEDVREVYLQAYELGAKGVTIYRDGCKQFQILNTGSKKNEESKESKQQDPPRERVPDKSTYALINTGQGPLHIHINYDDEGPLQLFANLSPTGTEISGMATALGILISKYFEQGGNPNRLLKHLNSIKGDKPFGFGPKRVDSIAHGLSKVLKDHLVMTGKFEGMNGMNGGGQTVLSTKPASSPAKLITPSPVAAEEKSAASSSTLFCPKCFSTNVEMVSGCSEPTCFDCGYSKCS